MSTTCFKLTGGGGEKERERETLDKYQATTLPAPSIDRVVLVSFPAPPIGKTDIRDNLFAFFSLGTLEESFKLEWCCSLQRVAMKPVSHYCNFFIRSNT